MTQYLEALSGNVTPEMIAVVNSEFHEPETIRREIAKVQYAVKYGADTVMDLST